MSWLIQTIKPEDELRREAPQLIFWFYGLGKTYFSEEYLEYLL